MSDADKKKRAIDMALSQIERQFGKGSIMKLGADRNVNIPIISSGSLSIDAALGIGGFPRGRVVEIYGPESSGKTTVALHAIAEAQKVGGAAAFIDAEHAMDAEYSRKLGVNIDELLVSQPDSGEQALEIAEVLVRSGAIDILVIDFINSFVDFVHRLPAALFYQTENSSSLDTNQTVLNMEKNQLISYITFSGLAQLSL